MQQTMSSSSGAPFPTQPSPRRDAIIVALITLSAALAAAHLELNERVFAFTRRFEHLQLDEWPIIALVLALCLMWLSWRRYRHALGEIQARQAAEARLTEVLAENRELARQSLLSIEAERKHLARELHDELGQYLNAIKIDAVAMLDPHGIADQKMSQRMLSAVDHIHGVVSDMIRRLRPVGLDELGLTAAVESCVEQWQERWPGTVLAFQAHGELEGFSEHANLTVYRLVQEALTNSFKHAGATRIDITLTREADAGDLILTVTDNGRGMDTPSDKRGFGLSGMRERVEMLGGAFSYDSEPARGFSIEARIPAGGLQ
jgi:signal transduction histidine kinase